MKNTVLTFLAFCFFTTSAISQFTLLGNLIDGNGPNDNFGWAVALDENGYTLAVGAPLYDDDFGQVRVYKLVNNVWTQIGQDINGASIAEQFGFSLALNGDGTRLALGGLGGSTTQAGHIRMFKYNGSQWQQMGSTIVGEVSGDQFGFDLEMNLQGTRVVAGARRHNADAGSIKVYEWQNNDWVLKGQEIDGEDAGDQFGTSVSMNGDGSIIAAGGIFNGGGGSDAGHVRVYQLQGNSWVQMGADIDGQNINEFIGLSVSLSNDGQSIAVSASGHNHGNGIGSARVYQFSGGSWSQVGSDVQSNSSSEAFAQEVAISGDGMRLATGTTSNDDIGLSSGKVNIYQLDNNNWTEITPAITGTAQFDFVGKDLCFNHDGTRIAIGANLANGTAGYTIVYEDSQMPVGISNIHNVDFSVFAFPDLISVRLSSDNNHSPLLVNLYDMSGRLAYSGKFAFSTNLEIRHDLPKGIYGLQIIQDESRLVRKLVIK